MEKKLSIMFVDDELNILQGLRRQLRSLRGEWDMCFIDNGHEVLKQLESQHFDVIVSDMRMPEMDGAELLSKIKQLYPHMVRLVLSGYSDQDMTLRAAESAHRYISKPCDPEELRSTVTKTLAVQQSLHCHEMIELVTQIDSLPSPPTLYQELTTLIRSEYSNVQVISQAIRKDPAMTAKILQLVNSSFFGLRQQVTNVSDAVKLLGRALIHSIALSTNLYRQLETQHLELRNLWEHSYQVACVARQIAMTEKMSKDMTDAAFTAGLLHDTGKLIFSTRLADTYTQVLEEVEETGKPSWVIENEKLGFNHAEIGGYLLNLWGLPDHIVSTVVFHHQPLNSQETSFSTLSTVHVANYLVNKHNQPAKTNCLDQAYIEKLGLSGSIRTWDTLKNSSDVA